MADPPSLAEQLVTATGLEYHAKRAEALALPPEVFNYLLASLEGPAATPLERTLARALRDRRENPALAQEFDQQLAQVLANPDFRARDGRARYNTSLLARADRSTDFLCFEMMLKGTTLPDALRFGFGVPRDSSGHRYAALADPFLALLDADIEIAVAVSAALVFLQQEFPDDRIVGAIAAAYKRWRVAPIDAERCWVVTASMAEHLGMIGGQPAKVALEDLIAFEQNLMIQQGFAPWDDAAAKARLDAATVSKADGANRKSRKLPPLSAEKLAAREAAYESAKAAWQRRTRWEKLTESLAKVNDALQP